MVTTARRRTPPDPVPALPAPGRELATARDGRLPSLRTGPTQLDTARPAAYTSIMSVHPASTLLLVSGSVRRGSVNSAALATAASTLPGGWQATMYSGLADLPHFSPDLDTDGGPRPVLDLRAAIRNADALLFSTPEYAGTLPGAFKNLLEWTIGDTVMTGKPVAWLNPSTAPRRAAGTYQALRTVLAYTAARIVEDACLDVPVERGQIGADGVVTDPDVRRRIGGSVRALTASAPNGR
ncbi:NAD(P)H-dependent FMN reductase [Actinoalloteichus cyanogriseus DSM 43889]|uniref:NAD(P)H-dependent FMN reductase n=2 Tax=Pseudonocardiaceae TaxID=2070 RepID=A0ABT1JRI1_ACTCY|nr:NAD(P)H-dependent FMN reductase [Actinoalloteichus caeruleus DSM 43889]